MQAGEYCYVITLQFQLSTGNVTTTIRDAFPLLVEKPRLVVIDEIVQDSIAKMREDVQFILPKPDPSIIFFSLEPQ